MMRRPTLVRFLLPLLLLASGAPARADTAVEQLLERAALFHARGRPGRARVVFEKVLRAVPNQPDALIALGTLAARAGDGEAARGYLERLERAHPGHPERGALAHAVRVGARFGPLIESARARARAGQPEEAVVLYRQAFGPTSPPPDLALEFFQTLGGTEGGWAEARAGLAGLLAKRRTPERTLALAKHLTYRESTRRDGVESLLRLAAAEETRAAALDGLRDALLWLEATEADVRLFRAFLAEREDAEVRGRLAALLPSARRVRQRRVAKGFEKLEASDVAGAKRDFQAAGGDAGAAETLVGLAAVALREERFDEAVALLEKAKRKAPDRPRLWSEALRAARFWRAMGEGRAALDLGQLDEARAAFEAAAEAGDADRFHALAGLGFVARARGDQDRARALFEDALELTPDAEPALRGLRDLALAAGDWEEALVHNDRLLELEAASARPRGEIVAEQARAEAREARSQDRPAIALRRLEAAREAQPESVWVLHDLVDLHLEQGQLERARAHLESLLAAAPALAEARVLHARLESASGRPRRALDVLRGIPREALTPDLARLRAQVEVEVEVEAATRRWYAGDRAGSKQALLRIQAERRLEPAALGAVAAGWSEIGAHDRAIATLQEGIALEERPRPGLLLQLAGVLLRAERFPDLADLLRQLESTPLDSAPARRDLVAVRVAFAVQIADAAREAGRYVRAFDALAPLLAEHPEDPALLSALGRVFRSSGRLQDAKEVFARILDKRPRDVDARAGAVETSLALGEREQAALLVDQGLQLEPDAPRMVLVEARYHAQLGEDREAMAAFARARRLAERRAMGESALGGRSLTAQAAVGPASDAPAVLRAGWAAFGFTGEASRPRSDTQLLLEAVAREERQIRSKHAIELSGGLDLRQRNGESGLGLLTEIGGYARASVPVDYAARVWVEARPVTVDTGARALDLDRAARFGSLGSVTGATVDEDATQRAGAALAVGFTWGDLSGQAGSTPLGFDIETFAGKLRYGTQLGDLGLGVEASREAVTDSLLSWAGMRDPGTGEVWGGVMRQGGRADLSLRSPGGLYYLFGGGYHLEGSRVAENLQWMGGLGAEWSLHESGADRVVLGVGGLGMGYERDLSYFTLGHGGYFSPQLFLRAGIPFEWRAEEGGFSWRLAADPGLNWFRTDEAAWFPTDPALQTARVAVAGTAEPSVYPARAVLSFSFNGGGELGYAVTPDLEAGARVDLHFAEDYEEVVGGLFVRYAFTSAGEPDAGRVDIDDLDRAVVRRRGR